MNSLPKPDPMHSAAQQRTLIQNEAFQAAINGEPLLNVLNILARLVKLELGSQVRTAFYLAYPDGKRLHAIEGAGDMDPAYTATLNGFPVSDDSFCSGYAMATGRPVHTPDVFQNPLWQSYRHTATAHGFRAASSYPILTRQGKAIGSLALYFPHVHQATAHEEALAKAITQAATIILSPDTQTREHTRAQDALRISEEKYRNLFESIDEGYAYCQLVRDQTGRAMDYRILELNTAFERQMSARRADFLGRTAREVFPGYDDWWIDTYARVVDTNQPGHVEHRLDNTGRWYAISAYPRGGDHFAVLFNDITERRKEELTKAFLLKLADALRPLSEAVDIQRTAMRVLGEQLQVDRVLYAEVDDDGETYSISANYVRGAYPKLLGRFPTRDFGEASKGLGLGEAFAIENMTSDERLSETTRAAFIALDVYASIGVPLIKAGRWVANLGVQHGQTRQWTAEDIALVKETAERTWAAVERAKAEEALRKSEAEFRTITEAAPALVWVCSALGENIYFNQRWYAYTGQTDKEASGHGWTTTMHPDDAARILAYWQRCQQTGESYEGEVRYQRYDGVYRWHIFRALARRNSAGQIEAWYGLSIDTDDAKQAQEGLLKADRRKDEFLAMLAHELRNPLAPVRNGLQLLAQTPVDNPILATLLPIMNRQMEHLMHLVDDLLDVSRISRGKIELHKQRMDLTQVVAQTVDAMQPLFVAAGRQLSAQLPDYPLYLEGDATRLNQVVANLLTNGLRYTQEGGHVELTLEPVGEQALLRVADNGIGLAADQLEAIFELFVQVNTNLARSNGGLGLGLSLVQQLVQLHGGRVEAHSGGLDQGSEFVINLPILID